MKTFIGVIYLSFWKYENDDLLNILEDKFENILYLDLRNLYPGIYNRVNPFSEEKLPRSATKFENIKSFKEFLKLNNVIVINGFGDQKKAYWPLLRVIKSSGSKMVGYQPNSGFRGSNKSISLAANQNSVSVKIKEKFLFLLYLFLVNFSVLPKYDLFFISGSSNIKRVKKYSYLFKKVIPIHSSSFETARNSFCNIEKKYIVFLDIAMPFIKDFEDWGCQNIDSKKYFESLNFFFNKLEREFNQEVIICAHPQLLPENDYLFDGRKVVRFETCSYVAMASIVVAHFTNALQYAVIFDKPIVFLDSKYFNSYIRESINYFTKEFKSLKVNLSNFNSKQIKDFYTKKFNKENYQNYKQNYLVEKSKMNKSNSTIVLEEFTQKFNLPLKK